MSAHERGQTMTAKHLKTPKTDQLPIRRRLCALAATAAFVASSVAPTAALAREAVAAGLGDTDPASVQGNATRSATVARSGAEQLLRDLGAAPEGKAWSWVTDTAATTRAEDVWRTSDGQEFATETIPMKTL